MFVLSSERPARLSNNGRDYHKTFTGLASIELAECLRTAYVDGAR